MNTSSLKSFAPAVRTQLMEAVGRKLDYVLAADTPDLRQAAAQVASLRREAGKNRAALIERVAYTWFNRLAALRFLDAQGWHPFKARVLTPATQEETQPEILKLLRTGSLPAELHPHTDLQRLNDLLDGRLPTAIAGADPQGEAYRGLILAACRFYHTLLPDVFDKLNDESELLLPDDLLTATSVAEGFRTQITDADCLETDASGKSRANVEILGWLYQFYISERKDQVMARKSAVPTEDIPAVTQLFTPHWIVRYLVENSLGRLWLLNRPASRLREHMPYYIEGEKDAPGGSPDDFLKITKPEEIRLCDPAVGSGHMLTYAFDLLTLIYEEEGYAPTEIPALILRHNLHGLEICPRAAQLAELALVFKAREKSRRFFQPEHLVRPRIIELRDVRFAENELRDYIHALGLGDLFNQPMLRLLHQFEEAKNFGSLIQPCLDERAIADARRAIEAKDLGGQLFLRETHLKVLRVLEQAEALTQRYHVVVANPPYMGAKGFNGKMKSFVETNYAEYGADLYSCFIARNLALTIEAGFVAMITLPGWMFLDSFETLRELILESFYLRSLVNNGRGAWGSDFGSCEFIIEKARKPNLKGQFRKLSDRAGEVNSIEDIERNFFSQARPTFHVTPSEFRLVPRCPLAFWVSPRIREIYARFPALGSLAELRKGLSTGENERFIRYYWEVSDNKAALRCNSREEAVASKSKWFPVNKGGEYRRWYGNHEFVINWEADGRDLQAFKPRAVIRSPDKYFRANIAWSKVTIGAFGSRYFPPGFIPSDAVSAVYPETADDLLPMLGLLNSLVMKLAVSDMSGTINFEIGQISVTPVCPSRKQFAGAAIAAVEVARADWDNFETSWDFRDQPLLRPGLKGATLEASWRNWEAQSTAAIRRMQELETENNRLFIAAYGLDGELQPEVPEEQITLARAEARRDTADFLSYAVGCMMGRYGLDHPGLILANAGDTLREFLEKVGKPLAALTFAPDEDGIIPVLDGEWFEDDIVARTRDFLRATFGEESLKQNLRFIEDSLGKSLDKYFLTDFYKDHLQTYKKRPIYWLFQSPKKGFSALVYVHRYTKDTVNTLLNKYLRDYLKKLESRINHLVHIEATATATKEKTAARKEAEKLRKDLKDCQDWERNTILPLAQQRLEIDLDDGVKVNYLKFVGAVQAIAGLASKED
jgi:hypothetical protein